MLARLLATVAALLLACAQASAHVRSERAADLGTFAAGTEHALDIQRAAVQASPGESAQKPKTATPARVTVENSAPGENAAVTHWHVCKNWSPLQKCTSGFGVELYAQARQYRAGTGRFTSRDEWAGDNLNPITLNKFLYGNGNPGSFVDPSGQYAEAGHYYTVFIAAKEAGYSTERALTIALYAQLPDEIGTLEAINQATSAPIRYGLSNGEFGPVERPPVFDVNNVQGAFHGLGAIDSRSMTDAARNVLINAPTDEAAGLAIHPLGDSYSHRIPGGESENFPRFVGHLVPGAAPDRIVERPGLYAKYAKDLVESLAARENRYMSMEQSTRFANSLAAMAEEPIAAVNMRIEGNKNGLKFFYDPTFGREGEMERAERELTERLRERALSLITVQESEDGQILLQPEENPLGHFAGTLGHEQSQLTAFYENSLEGMPLESSMYSEHSDASKVSAHAEAHVERMYRACQLRTCFERDEGIRMPESQ